jgi:hypothetical protein
MGVLGDAIWIAVQRPSCWKFALCRALRLTRSRSSLHRGSRHMVEFRIFGAMEGEAGGGLLDLGPPKQHLVLAAVLVGAGRPVGLGTLIDRVWEEEPPPGPQAVIDAHNDHPTARRAATLPSINLLVLFWVVWAMVFEPTL